MSVKVENRAVQMLIAFAMCLLISMMPVQAFAASTFAGDVDCRTNPVISEEGCEWSEETGKLVLEDITVDGDILLPASSITIEIKGNVKINGDIIAYDKYDSSLVTKISGQGTLAAKNIFAGQGALEITDTNVTVDTIYQASVGGEQKLLLKGNATLDCVSMEWMTDGGVDLSGQSQMDINGGRLWAETLSLGENTSLSLNNASVENYGHFDFGPAIKDFLPNDYEVGKHSSNQEAYTILDENGNIATNFTLQRHYTVTVKTEGKGGTATPEQIRVPRGTSATVKLSLDNGYEIKSINDSVAGELKNNVKNGEVVISNISSDGRTVIVTFKKITVSFDDQTGNDDSVSDIPLKPDGTLTEIPLPFNPNPGYDFIGWFPDKEGKGEEITEDTVFNSSQTVYAVWAAKIIDDKQDETTVTTSPQTGDPEDNSLAMKLFIMAISAAVIVLACRPRKETE